MVSAVSAWDLLKTVDAQAGLAGSGDGKIVYRNSLKNNKPCCRSGSRSFQAYVPKLELGNERKPRGGVA